MNNNNLIVYQNRWIIESIYRVSDRIRHEVRDQTLFEDRCIKRVGDYLEECSTRLRNRRYIERLINEVASAAVIRNKNEHSEVFTDLAKLEDDGDEEVEFEPIDVLADVESEVITKRTITLLAKSDRRRMKVLEAWKVGNTNDNQISRMLAHAFGGNSESHRKFIQRFRLSCQTELTDIMSAVV